MSGLLKYERPWSGWDWRRDGPNSFFCWKGLKSGFLWSKWDCSSSSIFICLQRVHEIFEIVFNSNFFLSEFEVKIGSISGGVNQEPRWVRLARPVYLSADAVLKKIIEIRLRVASWWLMNSWETETGIFFINKNPSFLINRKTGHDVKNLRQLVIDRRRHTTTAQRLNGRQQRCCESLRCMRTPTWFFVPDFTASRLISAH